MKNLFTAMCLLMALAVSFTSCKDEEPTPEPTLYDNLGGVDAISAVVDQFLTNVVNDTVINGQFSETIQNPEAVRLLRTNLIDQICEAAGGPCIYKGLDMVTAHTGMNITNEEFNALVGDLVAALNQFNVAQADQDALLGVLGGMQGDIVGK